MEIPPRHSGEASGIFSTMTDARRSLAAEAQGTAAAREMRDVPADQDVIDIELLNHGYVCPPHAGPAWRAACAAGVDMGLIEDALRMSPGERLRAHQHALNLVLAVAQVCSSHDSGS